MGHALMGETTDRGVPEVSFNKGVETIVRVMSIELVQLAGMLLASRTRRCATVSDSRRSQSGLCSLVHVCSENLKK